MKPLLGRDIAVSSSSSPLPSGNNNVRTRLENKKIMLMPNNQRNSINTGHWSLKSETAETKVGGPKSWELKKGRIGQNSCHSCIFCFLWLEGQNPFQGLGIVPPSQILLCHTYHHSTHQNPSIDDQFLMFSSPPKSKILIFILRTTTYQPCIVYLEVHLLNIDLGSDLAKGAARVQLHFAGIIPGGGQKNL